MLRRVLAGLKRLVTRHTGIVRMYHEHMRILAILEDVRAQVERQGARASDLGVMANRKLDQQATVLAAVSNVIADLYEKESQSALRAVELQDDVRATTRLLEEQNVAVKEMVQRLGVISAKTAASEDQVAQLTGRLSDQFSQVAGRLSEMAQHMDQLGQIDARLGDLLGRVPDVASWQIDRFKVREYEGLLRYLRKKDYLNAISDHSLEVPALETAHPVAVDTDDTLFPWGAKNDNSIYLPFNQKLYRFLDRDDRLKVLDLGCAGGGFVRSLIDDGHLAVGLEGSPYPKITQSGEWGTIPYHLHTCDITKPFVLRDPNTRSVYQFDVITAWEFLEHIREDDLRALFVNIDRHLAPGGCFVASVSTIEDRNERTGASYHQTVRPAEWWHARFPEWGFEMVNQDVIGKDDWLRGSGNCRYDRFAEDEGIGFHIVLRRRAVAAAAA
jgi:SAM-dependent methyltransferase